MYRYDSIDQQIVDERVAQFRNQTERFLNGELTEDEFRPLRLQNGLYVQRHAPMLRIAIPYGNVNSTQLRMFARIARDYDKGYAHFTTRQNIQYNWPKLEEVPDILALLASVQIHGIQTSGNCIRNTTSDPFAGLAVDEIDDPRPWCELIRQWSTFHPEFAFLPRKFKIAVSASAQDRALIQAHDIGVELKYNAAGELGFRILAGGGLGRTPIIGSVVSEFVPWPHLLTYCEAILRVYNLYGRRDNMYKARIKILVKALGIDAFRRQVEDEFVHLKNSAGELTVSEVERVKSQFVYSPYRSLSEDLDNYRAEHNDNKQFSAWLKRNVHAHKQPGYASVVFSLKDTRFAPGDITAEQLDAAADLADHFSFGFARVSHEQNLILPDVEISSLHQLWQYAQKQSMATANIGLLNDIICCPGGDFCSLANAKSIPIANAIQQRFDQLDYLFDIGDISLNISGCMNACGHHHVGNIGILGVDKKGEEWYQIALGGQQGNRASIAKVIGRSFAAADIPDVISKIIDTYLLQRHDDELFIDTYERVGIDVFKLAVYGASQDKGQSDEQT